MSVIEVGTEIPLGPSPTPLARVLGFTVDLQDALNHLYEEVRDHVEREADEPRIGTFRVSTEVRDDAIVVRMSMETS